MSLCLIITSIDPYGYYGTLPDIIESLFSNIATNLGLIILFIFISNLLKISSHVTYYQKRLAYFYGGISFMLTIIFSFLQSYVNENLFRGIKLITLGVSCLTITIYLNYLMILVRKNLLRIYGNNIDGDSSLTVAKIINKLVVYLCLYNFLMLMIISFQFYSGINSVLDHNSINEPMLTPDMIFFPLAQIASIIFGIAFTWNKVNEDCEERSFYDSYSSQSWLQYIRSKLNNKKPLIIV
jgi:hypothetical protein